jgi:C4-dicarboxylate transporter DctM subunit
MDPFWIGCIGIVALFVLIMLRVPIAFALMGIGTLGIIYMYSLQHALAFVPPKFFDYLSKFTFTAVPLFLLMGYLAFSAGLTNEAYDAAKAWVGALPGGLALTTIIACTLFAATAGSSLAECAAMAKISVPEMRRSGYSYRFATGVVAAAGGMAIVIPPSIILIIYGVITETSVGQLLIAGILPGILLFAVFGGAVVLFSYFSTSLAPSELNQKTSWRARRASFKKVWSILALFSIIMGGIYSGFVTATEAAALGVVGATAIAMIKRRLGWKSFISAIVETGKATTMLFLLVGGASVFTVFMSLTGVISSTTTFLVDLNLHPFALLCSLFLLYIFLGTFLDSISMMLLTFPLVIPIIEAQGFSLIWFGIVMCMLVEIGCITPPMGLNVYVIKGVLGREVELNDIFAGALPFVLLYLLVIFVLYVFPDVVLWLPSLMRK